MFTPFSPFRLSHPMGKMSSLRSFGLRTIILLWASIFVVSKRTTVERIPREKYLEAKQLVKSLNRPSVKSFQVENGDIFDCVPTNKQLAFDHPSLKNHTIEMRPTSIPSYQKNKNSSYIYSAATTTGLNGRRCPVGSVLVRRIQLKDTLRRSTMVSNFGRKIAPRFNYDHHAVAIQEGGPFYGTEGFVGLWKPKLYDHNDRSTAQFWFSSGPERVEAGWIVLDNNLPEFFISWTRDDYVSTGCFNLQCPGFVQESRKITPGIRIGPVSTYGGEQHGIQLTLFKDPRGNLVLLFDGERIGYWPKELFTSLKNHGANRVTWGGETFTDISDQKTSYPEMGSGHFPAAGNGKACFIWGTRVSHKDVEESFKANIISITNYELYRIDAVKEDKSGKLLSFGGPGHP